MNRNMIISGVQSGVNVGGGIDDVLSKGGCITKFIEVKKEW